MRMQVVWIYGDDIFIACRLTDFFNRLLYIQLLLCEDYMSIHTVSISDKLANLGSINFDGFE